MAMYGCLVGMMMGLCLSLCSERGLFGGGWGVGFRGMQPRDSWGYEACGLRLVGLFGIE